MKNDTCCPVILFLHRFLSHLFRSLFLSRLLQSFLSHSFSTMSCSLSSFPLCGLSPTLHDLSFSFLFSFFAISFTHSFSTINVSLPSLCVFSFHLRSQIDKKKKKIVTFNSPEQKQGSKEISVFIYSNWDLIMTGLDSYKLDLLKGSQLE